MKKVFVYAIAGALLVSSCGSYTASGAYTGSTLGSILGSAIGGLSDGPRGSDLGSIIGMAGGAVVGAAIGSAADKAQERRIMEKREEIQATLLVQRLLPQLPQSLIVGGDWRSAESISLMKTTTRCLSPERLVALPSR